MYFLGCVNGVLCDMYDMSSVNRCIKVLRHIVHVHVRAPEICMCLIAFIIGNVLASGTGYKARRQQTLWQLVKQGLP